MRGFDDPQADPDVALVLVQRVEVRYVRGDLYSLPPVFTSNDTLNGNPPWGSCPTATAGCPSAPDNDADGQVDPSSVADRHNKGMFSAIYDKERPRPTGQFPNDAFGGPSCPLGIVGLRSVRPGLRRLRPLQQLQGLPGLGAYGPRDARTSTRATRPPRRMTGRSFRSAASGSAPTIRAATRPSRRSSGCCASRPRSSATTTRRRPTARIRWPRTRTRSWSPRPARRSPERCSTPTTTSTTPSSSRPRAARPTRPSTAGTTSSCSSPTDHDECGSTLHRRLDWPRALRRPRTDPSARELGRRPRGGRGQRSEHPDAGHPGLRRRPQQQRGVFPGPPVRRRQQRRSALRRDRSHAAAGRPRVDPRLQAQRQLLRFAGVSGLRRRPRRHGADRLRRSEPSQPQRRPLELVRSGRARSRASSSTPTV